MRGICYDWLVIANHWVKSYQQIRTFLLWLVTVIGALCVGVTEAVMIDQLLLKRYKISVSRAKASNYGSVLPLKPTLKVSQTVAGLRAV